MAEEEKKSGSSILKKLKIRDTKSSKQSISREEREKKTNSIQKETNPERPKIAAINSDEFEMVATCMQNMEPELEKELERLGAKDIRVGRRAVKFKGDLELLYACNI